MSASTSLQRYGKPLTPESDSETDSANAYIKMFRLGGHFAPEWMNRGRGGEEAGDDLRRALHERRIQQQAQHQPLQPHATYRDWLGRDASRGGWAGQGYQQPIAEDGQYAQGQGAQDTPYYGQYGYGYGDGQYQQHRDYYQQQAYHQPLYPAAQEGWCYQQPCYSGQQQQQVYAHIQLQPLWQPYQSYISAPEQTWLTQQFQAYNNVPPPPPAEGQYAGCEDVPSPPPPPRESPVDPSVTTFSPQQPLRYGLNQDSANHRHPAVSTYGSNPPRVAQNRVAQQTEMFKAMGMPGLAAKWRKREPNPPKKPAARSPHQTDSVPFKPPSLTLPFRTSPLSPKTPHLKLLKRPDPSEVYLRKANQELITLAQPRSLLVILDLNGTLLYRRNKGSIFTERPKLREFLHYLLYNHKVMVWSSAISVNVQAMVDKLFTAEDKLYLVGVWTRDHLRLTPQQFNMKVQVYKQLSWVWKDADIQMLYPDPLDRWSQENTVLIDDNVEKAASEPYNIIQIEEFEARPEQMQTDVLGQVVNYLDTLSMEGNVSAYIKEKPFIYDRGVESYDH